MAVENFGVNTLIIPMDVAYQNNGMYRAYGLVYNLLSNGIPVKWAIQSGKPFDGTDFVATAQDLQTLAPVVNHNYTGGPFIIDSAFAAQALPYIVAWQAANPNVKVHRATAPFSADIAATMNRPPRIAVEAANAGIVINYLNLAGIPDSLGNAWSTASPDVLSETEIAAGALFGFDLTACRRPAYDIFLSPHTGTGVWDDPNLKLELNDFLYLGGMLHAMCESIPSIENTAGPFLTVAGINDTNKNGGDPSSFTVDIPDFPTAQAVSTGQVQAVPGGSVGTLDHSLQNYNPETQVIAHFTEKGTQFDFMIAGPYKNGAGAGKVEYEGGHNYGPGLPYTSNDTNLYYRFFLDALYFAVGKPLMYLEFSTPNPGNVLFQNTVNTITFRVVNTGASPATGTSFSVTLAPGVTYNAGSATIPPTSIVGQTLSWSAAALDTVPPGTVLTFTANYQPGVPGPVQLATFSTGFGDENNEDYSMNNVCIEGTVEQFDQAFLNAVKTVDKTFATTNETLTYTVTITNNGILPANNVTFTDPDPAGATFVPNSVTIAIPPGAPAPALGADPNAGIPLPIIPPGGSVVVSWQVTVDDTNTPIDIINQGHVAYSFTNQFGTFNAVADTNEVITQIEIGQLTPVKSANRTIATVCDTITYTVVITNTGTVTANNVFFRDTAPNGTSFVPGSVTVDGNPVPGDPGVPPGVPLPSIPAGGSVTVTFQVHVDFIPPPPPDPPIAANTAFIDFTFRVNPQGPDIPGLANSNPVITQLVTPQLTVVKSEDKAFVEVGDTVTYTVNVTNTGNVTANNVVLTDPPPAGTSFIPGTITVNGLSVGGNPSSGIPLGNIAPGATVPVTFQVLVTSVPVPNPTTNIATARGSFTIEPGQPPRVLDFPSNPLDLQVEVATLDVIKSVDKPFVEVGETVTYTVVINNPGTVAANNVVFTDSPPPGTSFVPGSVTLNGLPIAGNPSAGIPIGNIPAGGSATVTFQVTVDSIPVPNPTINTALINAEFPVNPNEPPVPKEFESNPVPVRVEVASLTTTKAVDLTFAEVCQNITYTVTLTNTGTVPANNVIFTDVPPNGTSFVPSSVTINGIPDGLANPASGINIGTIPAGGSVIITFKVHADFIPVPNPTTNIGLIQATFPVNPENPITKDFETNPVDTRIEIARLDMVKTADKAIAAVGETVTYTVLISNTGSVPANNVVFTDSPPPGTEFVPGSVTVNGAPNLLANPATGFNIGNIPAGGFTTVTFQVTAVSIPTPNPTINIAFAEGTFPVNPNNPVQKEFESNPLPVLIEQIGLDVQKSTDKPFAEVGETVTYTVQIHNTGTVVANNVMFTDTPPAGTQFVPGSVTLNGAPIPGDPSAGINIGSIPAGGTATVTFKVTVVSVPTPNPTQNIATVTATFPVEPGRPPLTLTVPSNPVDLTAVLAQLNVVKNVDKPAAIVGDTLTYTVTVTNTGNVDATATLFDLVPAGTVFVPNSLTIDGVPVPGAIPSNGVDIGTLTPGQTKTITFQVTITTMPEPPEVVNMATIEFEYIVNPEEPPRSKTQDSNEVVTTVEEVGLELVKTADKTSVIRGDIITYTVKLTNTGTLPLTNVIFKDPIPAGTSYVEGSFTINGAPVPGANPEAGVNVGTINPGQTVTITFQVRYDFLPCPPVIRNIAFAEFNFRIVSSGPVQVGVAESNPVDITGAPTNFKQFSVDETLCLPTQKPDIEDILNTLVTVTITQTRVIKTLKGTSAEGQEMTGWKLIIEGILHQKIEYVANEPTQSVHAAEFNVPFSTFIILPETFIEDAFIDIQAYVEDVYVKQLGRRCIFKNVTLRLEANITC